MPIMSPSGYVKKRNGRNQFQVRATKSNLGVINVRPIYVPDYYIGKSVKIKIELVKHDIG